MPNKATHARAICPFFKGNSRQHIFCESLINSGKKACTEFASEKIRSCHEESFCDTFKYKHCPMAIALDGKYQED